mmetsp:Transcript_6486/g.11287  ORF Transcript_6486/g.11287 Transcript_6486/m.11287 type:complete len:117 (-) Transcript_6486:455-805(-)
MEEEENEKNKAKGGRKGKKTKRMMMKSSKKKKKLKKKSKMKESDDMDDDYDEPFPNDDACPEEAPITGDPCQDVVPLVCEYGEESCCGQTFTSFACDCFQGEFSCFFTDYCLLPGC